jgi:hypothetical protein
MANAECGIFNFGMRISEFGIFTQGRFVFIPHSALRIPKCESLCRILNIKSEIRTDRRLLE